MFKILVILLLAINFRSTFAANSDENEVCGVFDQSKKYFTNDNNERWSFPWTAALIRLNGRNFEYLCGGTLISERHVVTGKLKLFT